MVNAILLRRKYWKQWLQTNHNVDGIEIKNLILEVKKNNMNYYIYIGQSVKE